MLPLSPSSGKAKSYSDPSRNTPRMCVRLRSTSPSNSTAATTWPRWSGAPWSLYVVSQCTTSTRRPPRTKGESPQGLWPHTIRDTPPFAKYSSTRGSRGSGVPAWSSDSTTTDRPKHAGELVTASKDSPPLVRSSRHVGCARKSCKPLWCTSFMASTHCWREWPTGKVVPPHTSPSCGARYRMSSPGTQPIDSGGTPPCTNKVAPTNAATWPRCK
mmetsp:Transcript_851/g.3470  ORF Transcript_851/g.3470 Transcript_851/m.3470 type:complete len:215 (-) Transcript_851:729-1373(-)